MDDRKDGFEVECRDCGRVFVITPHEPEITFKNSKYFLEEVRMLIDTNELDILLDLQKIELIDSVSLGTLITIKKYAKSSGRDVSIARVSPLILELFNLLNFGSVFEIYDSVEDALKAHGC